MVLRISRVYNIIVLAIAEFYIFLHIHGYHTREDLLTFGTRLHPHKRDKYNAFVGTTQKSCNVASLCFIHIVIFPSPLSLFLRFAHITNESHARWTRQFSSVFSTILQLFHRNVELYNFVLFSLVPRAKWKDITAIYKPSNNFL